MGLQASTTQSGDCQALGLPACEAEIARVTSSPLFLKSESLSRLLRFLAQHALDSPNDHLKEYEIATTVFGRHADFDPKVSAEVRVIMGRLRARLAEYYQTAGASDHIEIEVPKGAYSLLFRRRDVSATSTAPENVAPAASGTSARTGIRLSRLIVAAALVCILATVGVLIGVSHRQPASSGTENTQIGESMPAGLRTFWGPFLQRSDVPFVVFSNAEFVGNPNTGMRYYDPAKDSHDQVFENYTGIGEVIGVQELQGLFLRAGRQIRIKRGGLFTVDDARKNNLIFVGSPTENLKLGEIPYKTGFVFKLLQARQNYWVQGIVDLQPRAGESSEYVPASELRAIGTDYAVITLTHGLDRSRWILILEGATTVGTQAAVDYACNPDAINDLLRRLNIQPGSEMKSFEALLRVKVANAVPLNSELVKVRGIE